MALKKEKDGMSEGDGIDGEEEWAPPDWRGRAQTNRPRRKVMK